MFRGAASAGDHKITPIAHGPITRYFTAKEKADIQRTLLYVCYVPESNMPAPVEGTIRLHL